MTNRSCHNTHYGSRFLGFSLLPVVLLTGSFNLVMRVSAWGNGGWSNDPSSPDYGTHDWIAEQAMDWLPDGEREYIANNLASYLYGTELPDNANPEDGIGDTPKHHIYFSSDGILTDASAAVRAQQEYDNALEYLNMSDFAVAAKVAGIMSHYIADMAVFAHVMGSDTDWGSEAHHGDYEEYVNDHNDSFNPYLLFDGRLDNISAYEAALSLAYDTTFDGDGDLTCVWMDENYDWGNATFKDRCGESLNLAVNLLTDVLHTLHVSSNQTSVVEKAQSEVSCEVSSHSIEIGSDIKVSGTVNPAHSGVTVTVEYKSPNSSTIKRKVITDSDGEYNDSYTPTALGSWSVKVSWEGDSIHDGASSLSKVFDVNEKSFIETPTGMATIGGLIAALAIILMTIKRRRS